MNRFLPLALLIATLAGADPAPVTVSVSPRIQMALYGKTAQIQVRLTVPRDAQNRAVCVSIDGPMLRSSCHEIAGAAGAYREEWVVRSLEPGRYDVLAVLERADGSERRAKDTFCVAGGAGECGLGGEP